MLNKSVMMTKTSTGPNKFSRLFSMDGREVFDRLRQSFTARADLLRYRMGHEFTADFAVDGGSEKADRFGRFFFEPAEVPSLCALLEQTFPARAEEIVFQAEKICRHQFDLLGYKSLDFGRDIDWHCDVVHGIRGPRFPWFKVKYLDFDQVGDAKITWELNRHQHFVVLAKAYWLTRDDRFVNEILVQWTDWQKENVYPIGINWGSSLEVGYRSLSWIWTFFLLRECPRFTPDWHQKWQRGLSLNGRHIANYLSTYFSPNTHLLGEAMALFFLGTLFPKLRQAKQWQELGWKILVDGARTQVADDGFYIEQSTYYHIYALDIFLHARILAGLGGVAIPDEFDQTVQRMLNALLLLGRAGAVPALGDDDGGRVFDGQRNQQQHLLDPLATGAVLYGRGDYKLAIGRPHEEMLWLLGPKGLAEFESLPKAEASADSVALASSGYYLMADADSRQQLVIDCGPLGWRNAGHGHADALSLTLIRNQRNLLIDPGTFEYVGDSGERARLRGTGAHNTMLVDGQDQAEATGPFSWKNCLRAKAESWIVGREFDFFEGSHDGYCRLTSPVTHRRWVFHRKRNFWFVRDRAEGRGHHQLDIAWHMGASLSPVSAKEHIFVDGQEGLALLTAEGQGWGASLRRDVWSPAYGRSESASGVNFGAQIELPADFATVLIADAGIWEGQAQRDRGRLVRLNTVGNTTSFWQFSKGAQEHNLVFRHQAGPWTCGPWTSDADFLYWSLDREKQRYDLILCFGSYADAGGERVLSCDRKILYAEVSSSAEKVNVLSSHPESVQLRLPLQSVWGSNTQ
ncbi:MAG TPA: alginate lyase family protein [Terriglobales bacterium]|nr:alginate lyase family protein [Terriglobales bacterium]